MDELFWMEDGILGQLESDQIPATEGGTELVGVRTYLPEDSRR